MHTILANSKIGVLKDEVINVVSYDNSKKATLYIDSADKTDGTYQRAFYDNKNKMVNKQIYNMGVKEVDLIYGLNNINADNKDFSFTVQNEGGSTTYQIILDEDNYETALEMGTEIVAKMNAQVNIFTLISSTNNSYTIDSADTFNFNWSSGIQNSNATGIFVSGLTLSIKFYPSLQYTRYIDFVINEVKDSIITRDTFTKTKSFSEKDHIVRLYIDSVKGILETKVPRKIVYKYKHINYFPVRSRDIDTFEIRLYTDKGFPIYVETQNINGSIYENNDIIYGITFNMTS